MRSRSIRVRRRAKRAGHRFIVQVMVDVLAGGSSDGPLDIRLSLQGGNFSAGETLATWTGQGVLTFNHLTIDEAGTYGISASASCESPTDVASITIDGDRNGRARSRARSGARDPRLGAGSAPGADGRRGTVVLGGDLLAGPISAAPGPDHDDEQRDEEAQPGDRRQREPRPDGRLSVREPDSWRPGGSATPWRNRSVRSTGTVRPSSVADQPSSHPFRTTRIDGAEASAMICTSSGVSSR